MTLFGDIVIPLLVFLSLVTALIIWMIATRKWPGVRIAQLSTILTDNWYWLVGIVMALLLAAYVGLGGTIPYVDTYAQGLNWWLIVALAVAIALLCRTVYKKDWSNALLLVGILALEYALWKLDWIPDAFVFSSGILANLLVVVACVFAIHHLIEKEKYRNMGYVALAIVAALLLYYSADGLMFGGRQYTDTTVSRKPAVSANSAKCPGKVQAVTLTHEWTAVNPDHPDALCDLSFAGDVDVGGPAGEFSTDPTKKGRTGTKLLTKIRAKGTSAQAYVMLCETGHGPNDGSWSCK